MICIQLLSALATTAPPTRGPFQVESKVYTVPILDASNQKLHVFYAVPNGTMRFPLISYAHGAAGGGTIDIIGYSALFTQIASYGYVIAAPASCNDGCKDTKNRPYTDCAGLPQIASAGWNSWYGEQLKTIVWAKNQSTAAEPIFSTVDWSAGVGVAGHSMGGQATTTSAHHACAAQYDIRAAVLHHAAPCELRQGGQNAGLNVTTVPLAAFTSSGDRCCENSTRRDPDVAPSH
jgi:dienelactone hydrolase